MGESQVEQRHGMFPQPLDSLLSAVLGQGVSQHIPVYPNSMQVYNNFGVEKQMPGACMPNLSLKLIFYSQVINLESKDL